MRQSVKRRVPFPHCPRLRIFHLPAVFHTRESCRAARTTSILRSSIDSYDGGVRIHLASLVEDFQLHAAETAVVAHRGNRRYATTYGELAELAGRFAAELERRGMTPGERVVLWGANSAEWIGVFFGCLLRGVIAVPLDAAGSSEFANRVVKDVSPKLIVVDRALLGSLECDVPRLLFSEVNAQLPTKPMFAVSDAVNFQTPFQIIFTSGTTAEPKGVVLTHGNVLASLQPIEDEIAKYLKYERWVHPLRFLHSVPLSHVFGQFMGLWTPPLLAAEVHFGEQLEPSRLTELIRREHISVLVTVPRVLHLLRTHLLARYRFPCRGPGSGKGSLGLEAMVVFPTGASRARVEVLGGHLWRGDAADRSGRFLEQAWVCPDSRLWHDRDDRPRDSQSSISYWARNDR